MAKAEDWAQTLDELTRRRDRSRAMGGDERVAKHHGKGKLDARGRIVSAATSGRRIGLGLERLREMPNVVGVAGGRHKAEAVLGAIRGGFIKVLVTDENTAEELLAKGTVDADAARRAGTTGRRGRAT